MNLLNNISKTMLLLLLLIMSSFALNINTCTNLSSANTIYTLTANVSNSSTCFTINASNVTLDCQHNIINITSGFAGTFGVTVSNRNNISILNCNISMVGNDAGIKYFNITNGSIINNSHIGSKFLRLEGNSSNILIQNNTADYQAIAILAEGSTNISVLNNTFHPGNTCNAIELDTQGTNNTNWFISQNTFLGINYTCIGLNGAIIFQQNTSSAYNNNNTIYRNNISNFLINGIYIGSNYNNITENNLFNNSIQIYVTGQNNTIYNNIFNATNGQGSSYATNPNNLWNLSKTLGTNIIGGPYLGGNFYSDYNNCTPDGIGSTRDFITNGTDYLPLVCLNTIPITNSSGVTINASGNYSIIVPINSSGTGVMINASNVSLICAGGSIVNATVGINTSNSGSVSIANCSINNTQVGFGGLNNSALNINNVSISSNQTAISIDNSSNVNVICDGTVITAPGGIGIKLRSLNNTNLNDCIVNNANIGLSINISSNVTINKRTINNTNNSIIVDGNSDLIMFSVQITNASNEILSKGGSKLFMNNVTITNITNFKFDGNASDVSMRHVVSPPVSPTGSFAFNKYVNITNVSTSGNANISVYFGDVIIPNGYIAQKVRIEEFNTTSGLWQPVPIQVLDLTNKRVISQISAFSDFGIFIYPGKASGGSISFIGLGGGVGLGSSLIFYYLIRRQMGADKKSRLGNN